MASFDKMHNRNQEATVWVGGIEPQCTEEIVWELMVQCGPVVDVTMPRDKVTGTHQGYAFCEFGSREDADYCIRVMNMLKLYGKHLRVNKAAKDTKEQEWFANLFVGNLSPEVDEKMLYDTFSQFGAVLSAKIMTKPESPETRGFAFVTFDSFESSDAAIQGMNGQFLHNQAIHVSYAYKKDGSKGEKHGTPAERVLAKKQQQQFKVLRPPPAPLSSLSMMRMNLPSIPMGLGSLPPRPPMGGRGGVGAPRPPPLPPLGGGGRGLMGRGGLPPTPPTPPTPPSQTPPAQAPRPTPPLPPSASSSSSSSSSSQVSQPTPQPSALQPPSLSPVQQPPQQQQPQLPPMLGTPMGRGISMPPLPPMGPLGRGLPPPPPPIAMGRGTVGMFPPPPPRPPMLPAFMMGRGLPLPGIGLPPTTGMPIPPRPPQ